MLKKMLKMSLMVMIMTSIITVGNAGVNKENIIKNLSPFFGKIEKQNITKTDFKGVYEVVFTDPIDSKLVSEDGNYFIEGSVIDIEKRALMTSNKMNELKADLIAGIDDKDKIIFKAKNEKYIVNVFTDVDCPYCKKLHSGMKQMNDLGITIKYLAFPIAELHPIAESRMEKIWCAKDRVQAMDDYKRRNVIPDSPSCDNPITQHLAIGKQLNVRGTPAMFLENGQQPGGYIAPQELLKTFKSNQS